MESYGKRWMHFLRVEKQDGTGPFQERKAYETLRDQLKFRPTSEQPHHPLSEAEDNPWNQFFEDEQLVREINTDLDRLYPQGQETFFHDRKHYMDMLRNVLFVWCKQHPSLAYRQGMHDLVAVLLYALISPVAGGEHVGSDDTADDFLEHDTFILFQRLMVFMEPLYAIQTIAPTTDDDENEDVRSGTSSPRRRTTSSGSATDGRLFRPTNAPDTDMVVAPAASKLQLLCHVVQYELLAKHDPQLACHLQNVHVLPETYCLRWIRLLLGREFAIDQALKVWDAMFAHVAERRHDTDEEATLGLLPYLCVAILVHFSAALRSQDNTGCLQLLMRPSSSALHAQTIIDSAVLMQNPMKENTHEDMDVVCFHEGSLGIVLTNAQSPYDYRLAVKEFSGQALESGKVQLGDLVESINGVKMYKISTDEIKKHIALLPRPLYVSFLHVVDSLPPESVSDALLTADEGYPPFFDGEQCYAHVETSMHQPIFHAPSGTCASHFAQGRLFLTNYRCLFQSLGGALWEIPILSIASIVGDTSPLDANPLVAIKPMDEPNHSVVLHCKDTQRVKFAFRDAQEFTRMYKCLSVLAFPATLTDAFCFHYRPHVLPSDLVAPFDIRLDYQRVGLLHGGRFRCIDQAYLLCDTYPRYLMVPADMSDVKLQVAAAFRSSQRLPVVSWQHAINHAVIARSSQPLVGLKSARCAEDEQLVQALCGLGGGGGGNTYPMAFRYIIMDARGQLAAAGNKAMGKGTESTTNYRGAKIVFMNMENIHTIRNAFASLGAAFDPLDTDQNTSFFQKVESSGWLKHVRLALKASWELADYVHSGISVLTHCSDGWDRTAQMVSLAELMLDPYYRTFEGFQVLIEKEWCSFGHQFGLRCGHARSDVTNDQRSPIFLLWLDCVWQLMRQFETEWEFGPSLLLFLADHVHSCKYGNFMFDCEKTRLDCFAKYNATNLWCDVEAKRETFANPRFSPERTFLTPSTAWKNIVCVVVVSVSSDCDCRLWRNYFARFDPTFVPPVECLQFYS
ncbi:Aste57867_14363 [Aphanomyces stellatus]|uniref:Aste57867_14363 protein n=1 Tax=Aphanomyces stellatus TaxID=120398 RepID=A0A485L0S4_9STRA|nr:hypothetical protein As57867_014309 [Aphanomyces stellatus]VFT91186.1 Aste57867_14363 [Aphanomyces stellatus]